MTTDVTCDQMTKLTGFEWQTCRFGNVYQDMPIGVRKFLWKPMIAVTYMEERFARQVHSKLLAIHIETEVKKYKVEATKDFHENVLKKSWYYKWRVVISRSDAERWLTRGEVVSRKLGIV